MGHLIRWREKSRVILAPRDSMVSSSKEVVSSDIALSSSLKMTWPRFFLSKRSLKYSVVFLALFSFMALIIPWVSPYTYYEINLPLRNHPPCFRFWMGTDELGRDLFTRVWWGARISLCIGWLAALIDLVIGVLYGSIAGILGGKIDGLMMRWVDIVYSIPHLLMVILFVALMGPGFSTIIIGLTLTGWIPMCRMVRGQIMQLKSKDYVQAAYALGSGHIRVWFKHLLPHMVPPILTTVTLTVPAAIFSEAFLSFLGLGCEAPTASWGSMVNSGLSAFAYFPWRFFYPAFCICITMLCFNVIGEGIRVRFESPSNL